jgi:hypothetical protein
MTWTWVRLGSRLHLGHRGPARGASLSPLIVALAAADGDPKARRDWGDQLVTARRWTRARTRHRTQGNRAGEWPRAPGRSGGPALCGGRGGYGPRGCASWLAGSSFGSPLENGATSRLPKRRVLCTSTAPRNVATSATTLLEKVWLLRHRRWDQSEILYVMCAFRLSGEPAKQ